METATGPQTAKSRPRISTWRRTSPPARTKDQKNRPRISTWPKKSRRRPANPRPRSPPRTSTWPSRKPCRPSTRPRTRRRTSTSRRRPPSAPDAKSVTTHIDLTDAAEFLQSGSLPEGRLSRRKSETARI